MVFLYGVWFRLTPRVRLGGREWRQFEFMAFYFPSRR